MWMAGGHHPPEILREERFGFRYLRARGREGRHSAVGSPRRSLDARVGVLLVVVADDQAIVVAIERARHRREPDVGDAAVARLANDVREFPLPLALADHGLVGGRDAGRETSRAANLRVRPGDVVRRAEVRAVRDIHAPGRPDQDRVVAGRLARHPVLNRRTASSARPVSGDERFALRQIRVVKPGARVRAAKHGKHLPFDVNRRHC